jgi:hypothetical protein
VNSVDSMPIWIEYNIGMSLVNFASGSVRCFTVSSPIDFANIWDITATLCFKSIALARICES